MSADKATFVYGGETPRTPNHYIRAYLCSRSAIFRELGWNMTSGDTHFQKQRKIADGADMRTSWGFFNLMQRIGTEMQETMGAMSLADPGQILDLCMAPGGYSASALKFNPRASVSGATLPEKLGGHKLFVRDGFRRVPIRVWQGDLTSLVGDMGIDGGDIPEEHPDFGKFQKDEVWAEEHFDLVFCDGQVLRNHSRDMAEYRQRCEARRLTCSQLLIALRHVRVGGSMVILLHKIDTWDTVLTLRAFDRFASIALFKPLTAHKARSSFYLVAKNVQPHHKDALMAIQDWTKAWNDATFRAFTGEGREDAFPGNGNQSTALGQQVAKVMDEFGERLIMLGEDTWKIQEEAIRKSPWFKEMKTEERARASTANGLQACQANSRTL
ncbi:MAG: hypothetical protein L6R40_008219 [Gallowayella cf. fulva]|nr:MAG: hypothetical protein L6R40_008219 [Xanthomendoza cf. fulva]